MGSSSGLGGRSSVPKLSWQKHILPQTPHPAPFTDQPGHHLGWVAAKRAAKQSPEEEVLTLPGKPACPLIPAPRASVGTNDLIHWGHQGQGLISSLSAAKSLA